MTGPSIRRVLLPAVVLGALIAVVWTALTILPREGFLTDTPVDESLLAWQSAVQAADLSTLESLAQGGTVDVNAAIEVPADLDLLSNPCRCVSTTALIWAIRINNYEMFGLLIRLGAEVTQRDLCGWSPLQVAAAMDRLDMLKQLVKLNDHPRCLAEGEPSARELAVAAGNINVVEWLREFESEMPETERPEKTLLELAVESQSRASVSNLVAAGVDVNELFSTGVSPLVGSILNGDAETAMLLIEAGGHVDVVDATGRRPLHLAIRMELPSVIDLVIERGADIHMAMGDQSATTPLGMAAMMGNIELVNRLLTLGADPKDPSAAPTNAAIILGAAGGKSEVCEALLDAGADVNFGAADSISPLHAAAGGADVDGRTVRLLLERGADVSVQDEFGADALDNAARTGCFEAFQVLAEHMAREVVAARRDELYDAALSNPKRGEAAKILVYLRELGQER